MEPKFFEMLKKIDTILTKNNYTYVALATYDKFKSIKPIHLQPLFIVYAEMFVLKLPLAHLSEIFAYLEHCHKTMPIAQIHDIVENPNAAELTWYWIKTKCRGEE